MGPSLLVVVLHYSGLADTLECVASLGRQGYAGVRTMVVDNGSAERPREALAAAYPWVEVVDAAENLGWSGGNNLGIRLGLERGVEWFCLLNNDTVVPPDWAERLMATAGALGACVLHPAIDSYHPGEPVQLDPGVAAQQRYVHPQAVAGMAGVYAITVVNGSCMLVHRAVFERIGLIDERFFLLCEDADFGMRAREAGFGLFCDVGVRIRHKESVAFGGRRRPIKTYYGIRNQLLLHEKHDVSWRGLWRAGRGMAWTVWGTAEVAGAGPRSWWGVVRWGVSGDTFARAARMGVRDYVRRRFGRASAADEALLRRVPGG